MNLIHQDGRRQTVPDAAYQRHLDTYTRAGWREDRVVTAAAGAATAEPAIKIRSKHGEERSVTVAEFDETYADAGWKRLDVVDDDADAKPAAGKKA